MFIKDLTYFEMFPLILKIFLNSQCHALVNELLVCSKKEAEVCIVELNFTACEGIVN